MPLELVKFENGEITQETFKEWAGVIEDEAFNVFWREGRSARVEELRIKLQEHVIGQLILFPEEEN